MKSLVAAVALLMGAAGSIQARECYDMSQLEVTQMFAEHGHSFKAMSPPIPDAHKNCLIQLEDEHGDVLWTFTVIHQGGKDLIHSLGFVDLPSRPAVEDREAQHEECHQWVNQHWRGSIRTFEGAEADMHKYDRCN